METGPIEGSFDFFKNLGFTDEEAGFFSVSWSFNPPDIHKDGEKAISDHFISGGQAERGRRNEMTDSSDWWQALQDRNNEK